MGPTNLPSALPADLTALLTRLASEWLFDPQRTRIFEQSNRALTEHLAEYRTYLVSKGGTAKHIRQTCREARFMIRLCKARRYGQLSPSTIQVALSKLRVVRRDGSSRGLRTCNAYLLSLKSFCHWMVNDYRADRSPCRSLRPFNTALDVRRARQALAIEQVLDLVKAATDAKPIAGIPGNERAMMYVLAMTSGLRAAELESLGETSFQLGTIDPAVALEAAYSKHRRRDVIPLRKDVAELIAGYLAQVGRKQNVFRRPAGDGTKALRADLQAAGIPYVDAQGRYADFHSLRHTFISELFRSGCTPKEGQTLARHSDPRLTLSRYCHVTAPALRTAVERSWSPRAFEARLTSRQPVGQQP